VGRLVVQDVGLRVKEGNTKPSPLNSVTTSKSGRSLRCGEQAYDGRLVSACDDGSRPRIEKRNEEVTSKNPKEAWDKL
jgi:hypothetical protein